MRKLLTQHSKALSIKPLERDSSYAYEEVAQQPDATPPKASL